MDQIIAIFVIFMILKMLILGPNIEKNMNWDIGRNVVSQIFFCSIRRILWSRVKPLMLHSRSTILVCTIYKILQFVDSMPLATYWPHGHLTTSKSEAMQSKIWTFFLIIYHFWGLTNKKNTSFYFRI